MPLRSTPFFSTLLLTVSPSYVISFDNALKEAAAAEPGERQEKMMELMKRSDARKAHPTLDHILPAYVAAGAAGPDAGEQLWTLPEGSLSWAQYVWGCHGSSSDSSE